MSGSRTLLVRWCLFVLGIAATSGSYVQAQGLPPLPAGSVPADAAPVVDGPGTPGPTFAPPADVSPNNFRAPGQVPNAPRIEYGLFDTISESLFGDPYAEGKWRPLTFGTFFSEGWNEAWAGAPAGREGLTPRHGWLGAFDGVFYRLWFANFSYTRDLNTPVGGNSYRVDYNIFLPLSKRFEIFFGVPLVVSNGTPQSNKGYTSQFGDLIIAPRFLLAENAATTHALVLGISAPTGTTTTGNGRLGVSPRYEFWTNPGGAWVVRGSGGINIPMGSSAAARPPQFAGGLAVGRYLTQHDALLGDLVLYLNLQVNAPLDREAAKNTFVSVGPGTRFHLADNWFFLNYWDFPVSGPQAYDYNAQFSIMKVF